MMFGPSLPLKRLRSAFKWLSRPLTSIFMECNVDIKPMSVNSCFQGRRFRTSQFKKWQEAVNLILPNEKIESRNISVEITVFLKSIYRSDIDNFIKPLCDCIVKKGIIEDDRYIMELKVNKVKRKKEGFNIKIKNGK